MLVFNGFASGLSSFVYVYLFILNDLISIGGMGGGVVSDKLYSITVI